MITSECADFLGVTHTAVPQVYSSTSVAGIPSQNAQQSFKKIGLKYLKTSGSCPVSQKQEPEKTVGTETRQLKI